VAYRRVRRPCLEAWQAGKRADRRSPETWESNLWCSVDVVPDRRPDRRAGCQPWSPRWSLINRGHSIAETVDLLPRPPWKHCPRTTASGCTGWWLPLADRRTTTFTLNTAGTGLNQPNQSINQCHMISTVEVHACTEIFRIARKTAKMRASLFFPQSYRYSCASRKCSNLQHAAGNQFLPQGAWENRPRR